MNEIRPRERFHDLLDHLKPGERLPPIRELASQLGIPLRQVQLILRDYQESGKISVTRGRGITRLGKQPAMVTKYASKSSDVLLYERMRDELCTGQYPYGSQLPKVAALAKERSVSTHTVCRAYSRLVEEELVIRHGRQFIVGSVPRSGTSSLGPDTRFSVIILQISPAALSRFVSSEWTGGFMQSFMRKLSAYGIRPIVITMHEDLERHNTFRPLSGRGALESTVISLRNDFRGILVLGTAWDYLSGCNEDFCSLIPFLCSFGKPVVWFDAIDEVGNCRGASDRHRVSYRNAISNQYVRKLFTRCRYDEIAGVKAAVRFLVDRGHRKAVFQSTDTGIKWVDHRFQYILAVTKKHLPELELYNGCAMSIPEDPIAALSCSSSGILRAIEPIAQSLREKYPSGNGIHEFSAHDRKFAYLSLCLAPFIFDQGVTAIIAPNDEQANVICQWLSAIGLRFPEDISVISFDDNLARQYPFAISSVNFGFDRLGYLAGHCIMRDISVKVGAERSVSVMPVINHQGSIGFHASK